MRWRAILAVGWRNDLGGAGGDDPIITRRVPRPDSATLDALTMPQRLAGYRWSTCPDGKMNRCGPDLARWLGASPACAVELQERVIHPDDRRRCAAVFGASYADREAFAVHIRIRRHDGAWVWCSVQGWPRVEGARFHGFAGVTVPVDMVRTCAPSRSASASSTASSTDGPADGVPAGGA